MSESKFQTQAWGLLLLLTSPTTGTSSYWDKMGRRWDWSSTVLTALRVWCVWEGKPTFNSPSQQSGHDSQLQRKVKIPHLPSHFPTCCTRSFALGHLALPMDSHQLTLLSACSSLGGLQQVMYPFWLEICPGSRGTHCFPQGRSVINEKEGWNASQLTWDSCSGNTYSWAKCPELLLWLRERNYGAIHLTPKWTAEVGQIHYP